MAPPKVPIEIKDLGIGKLKAALALLRKTTITIGYQGASGAAAHPNAPEGQSVALIALWQEYGTENPDGTPRNPARPFLETTFKRHQPEFQKAVAKGIADLIDGRAEREDVEHKLAVLGLDKMRATLDDSRSWAEPLAQSTIDRKGHDQPLLDSGTLRDESSWAIRRDGEIVKQGGEESTGGIDP